MTGSRKRSHPSQDWNRQGNGTASEVRAEMGQIKGICPSLPSLESMKKEEKRLPSRQVLHQVIQKPTGAMSSNWDLADFLDYLA